MAFQDYQEQLFLAYELSGGTRQPGTAGSNVWLDEHRLGSLTSDNNIAAVQEKGAVGVAAVSFGKTPTQQHGTLGVGYTARVGGAGAALFLGFLGHGAEVVSGAGDPYSHTGTPNPTSALLDTLTAWHNEGDAANCKKFTNLTLSGITFDASLDGDAVITAQMTGKWAGRAAAPSPTIRVGTTAGYKSTITMGQNVAFTVYNSAGVAYTANITRFNLQLARGVGMVPGTAASGPANPADICAGALEVTGSFDFEVDAFGATSLVYDFENAKTIGDATHIHTIVYTDSDGHTWTFKMSGGLYLDSEPLTYGNEYLSGSVSFTAQNDLSKANAASPAITSLKSLVIANGVSAALVG